MKKILLLIMGTVSLIIGSIGIILPLLPTTPLLLLSLWCYLRSSEKLYNFILQNKYLAPFVNNYMNGEGMPLKAKRKALMILWLVMGFSVIFVVDKPIVRIMMVGIAGTVSFYILSRKTVEIDVESVDV